MIQLDCACGKRLETEDRYAGQQFPCPFCGAPLTVPGASEAIRPASAAPAEYRAGRPDSDSDAGPEPEQRERSPAVATSGKAVASLALGLLTFCLPVLPTIPAIILGILAIVEINRSGGRLTGKGLAVAGLITGPLGNVAVLLAIWGVHSVRTEAQRTQSQHNLKIIGLAMHNYHDVYKSLPTAAIYSKDGQNRPLLSWRVTLLPYIEQFNLYKAFKLDEPWDSPHNSRLLSQMPPEYASPRGEDPPGHTRYLVFTGPQTLFPGPQGMPLRRIGDGTSNTLMVVEADDAVPWTKPADLEVAPGRPLPRLGGLFGNGFNALFADGSVRFLDSRRVNEPTLRLLIDPNDGQQLPADVLD